MALITPSTRAATGAETPAARPTAIRIAALSVSSTRGAGIAASARLVASPASSGRGQSAADQPVAQPRSGPHQPHPDRAGRQAKPARRLLRASGPRGSTGRSVPGIAPATDRPPPGFPGWARAGDPTTQPSLRAIAPPCPLMDRPALPLSLRPPRDATRDAEQPARDRIPLADRPGLSRQDQESGLEGILGGMRVVKHSPAGAEHHRAMSLDQGPERGFGRVIVAAAGTAPGADCPTGPSMSRPPEASGRS